MLGQATGVNNRGSSRNWIVCLWLAGLVLLGCSGETGATDSDLVGDDTTAGGGGGGDQSTACGVGKTSCAGVCANTATDAANCGSCGSLCGTAEICDQGQCRPATEGCSTDLLLCGQSCIDGRSDASNCGACGNACDPSNGVCTAGICGCAGGLSVCDTNACVDLLSDAQHCGFCSNACHSGQTCEGGTCTCPVGLSECGDACVDTQTDSANCGTCGETCAASQICQSGICACPESRQLCDETCTDTLTDTSNCGTCGTTCLERQLCTDGECTCPGSETECGDSCVDTATDVAHCGTCDNACPEDQVCSDGGCVCPEGETLCDGVCLDTQSDNANCGSCGSACGFGEGCAMGECSGGAEGDDGCAGLAQNIDVNEIAVYQTVKIPIMSEGAEVESSARISDVVSGRATLLRALVTPGAGWAPRTLSARLFLQNPETEPQILYSKELLTIRGESAEEQRDSAFEFDLEPEQITTETVYALELVECEDAGDGETASPRFPAAGGQELGARETGSLKIHIIPLQTNNRLPETEGEALQPYIDGFLAAYPISSLEMTVGEPIDYPSADDWNGMLDAVASKRMSDQPGPEVYYYGMLKPADTFQQYCARGCVAGVGFVPQGQFGAEQGRAAVGLAFGDEASVVTMLHEVGHNHGRSHAPCVPQGGQIDGVDRNFPYESGSVGVFGYDRQKDLITTPQNNSDVMGYCQNQWLSDYTYNALMDEVVSLNQTQFSVTAPAERIGGWQVLLVDASLGARWGSRIPGPTVARGVAETADVLDASGTLLEQVAVYRTQVSDIDGFSIQVPETQPGWHLVRVAGVGTIALPQP